MTIDLRDELRQQKAFSSLHQEAFLNLTRTENLLRDGLDSVLGPRGLSLTQYNVLRMLRGAGPDGLCRNEIRDRLISRMPDVSRLLDRMEASGLIDRKRSTTDRRLVNTTLTRTGSELVDSLDDEVARLHDHQLGHLTEAQLRTLIQLLSKAREKS